MTGAKTFVFVEVMLRQNNYLEMSMLLHPYSLKCSVTNKLGVDSCRQVEVVSGDFGIYFKMLLTIKHSLVNRLLSLWFDDCNIH